MNYSFMSFSCPELNLDELIAVAKKYGYNGIEPRISSEHKHGIELNSSDAFREECKQKAQASGIALCCIATSCSYSDPKLLTEQISDTHKAIDLAADVGAPRIRVFGGSIPPGITREAAIEQVSKSLKAVADHAAERDVILCMETHDDWCDPANVAEVMQRVNQPAIAVNWDIMHPVRVEKVTIDEAYQSLRPWIRHVHFHDGIVQDDGQTVLTPIGEGIIDHRRAVELLLSMNYPDFLSGEWINWEAYQKHLPRELAAMKSFEL